MQVSFECQNASEKRHSLPVHICKVVALDLSMERVDGDWRQTIRSGKDFDDNKRQASAVPPRSGKAELELFISISFAISITFTPP